MASFSRVDDHGAMTAVLLDPSLFTGPYDTGLGEGLATAHVRCFWAVRPLRRGQRGDLPAAVTRPIFYRHVEDIRWIGAKGRKILKSAAHFMGWWRLLCLLRRKHAAVLHVQWAVIPVVDAFFMLLVKRRRAVVMTVHDATPFNGETISFIQTFGFYWPARISNRVIVHTRSALETLAAKGIARDKISIIPHGPLTLAIEPAEALPRPLHRDPRLTFVIFGQIKPYKGIDILVEALGMMDRPERVRIIVAGAPMMDMAPIEARIAELGLGRVIELRLGRLSEPAMAALFDEADGFLFPYRQIDASGVYYLVRPLGKWIIASKVGVFEEDFISGSDGEQVEPANPRALADAIERAAASPPTPRPANAGTSWAAIGATTKALYIDAIDRSTR
ncbi:glycosyltransferase involved in cell wall biosynthesis [Sphingomonas sp. PP-CC-3A-396]|nr:glycosyltransferase involved in cell wall biosynthesis [Sphingomonas sp. PP-CC-3A-396]